MKTDTRGIMNDSDGTVQNEQFEDKKSSENMEEKTTEKTQVDTVENAENENPEKEKTTLKAEEENADVVEDTSGDESTESEIEPSADSVKEDETTTANTKDSLEVTAEDESEENKEVSLEDIKTEAVLEEQTAGGAAEEKEEGQSEEKISEVEPEEKTAEEKPEPEEAVVEKVEGESMESDVAPKEDPKPEIPKIDYSKRTKDQLVGDMQTLLDIFIDKDIKDLTEKIKVFFYKKHKADIEQIKKRFLEDGGQEEDFKPEPDQLEVKLKDQLKTYKEYLVEKNKRLEEEKVVNLQLKKDVIDEIGNLINRDESINQTFNEFRELQQRWRDIGLVPQQEVKNLWENYHYQVEKFYDYIKINKELRDLDLKKNLEAKITLCEKAEKLLVEPSVVNAFRQLQDLHNQWREIGPVPREMKTDIWNRFKEITSKINKKHHEYFEGLKQNQKQNLEQKMVLCEKAEEINQATPSNHKEWEEKSNELVELQKVWKTIGFAPKKDNNKIYDRFRAACDNFFNRKREFFTKSKEEQKNNLQLKTDLCIQAEALKDSTDWKNTTDDLIKLQKRWKEIGPVPKKYSDAIWTRFRAACDDFFNRKQGHFENIDSTYDDNLKKKQELIAEIEKYEINEDVEKNFEALNKFQKEWANIGFVPLKDKDEVQNSYREAINKKFDQLEIDESEKNILKYRTKISNLKTKPKADHKLRSEKDKFISRLKQLESDIVVWENNIGFFSNSKNAEKMIKEVQDKIENAKQTLETLKAKIRMIEDMEEE